MRTTVAIGLLGLILGVGRPLGGQGTATERESSQPSLPRRERVDLINSVLSERAQEFGQSVLIDLCRLSEVAGSGGDVQPDLLPAYRIRVVNHNLPPCAPDQHELIPVGPVLLSFERIEFEANEFIPPAERLQPRMTGLMVVRVRVSNSGSMIHTEEWVMRRARPGVWQAVTVRLFGFVVS